MPKPEKSKTLPTAPIASEIYEGGSYSPAPDQTWPTMGLGYDPQFKYRFSEVVTAPIKNKSILFKTNPRSIVKEIQYYRNPEGRLVVDTAYVERPEFTNYYPIKVQPRYGSTNDKNRDEYNILQRRFNEAKSVVLHQQGGTMNQQDLQEQIIQLVQAAMQGNKEAEQQIQQIMQAAQQGNQQAIQIAQLIQQVIEQMQGGSVKAALGAKLNYIQRLKGNCPEGEELVYFKSGGKVGCGCVKKAEGGVKTPQVDKKPLKKKIYINPSDTVWADGDKNKPRSLMDSDGKILVPQFKPYSGAEYKRDLERRKKGDKAANERVMKADEHTSYACGGRAKKKK